MDPTLELTLASRIFAFVNFASGVLRGSRRVLRTCRHKTRGIHVNHIHGDLRRLIASLNVSQTSLSTPERYRRLMGLAISCQSLSRGIACLLHLLQASNGTSWDTIRCAIRERGPMDDIRCRLDECRSEVVLLMTNMIRNDHLVLQLVLWGLHPASPEPGDKLATELRQLQDQLVDGAAREVADDDKEEVHHGTKSTLGQLQAQAEMLRARDAVSSLLATISYPSPEVMVLRQLCPDSTTQPMLTRTASPAQLPNFLLSVVSTGAPSEVVRSETDVHPEPAKGQDMPRRSEHTDSGLHLAAVVDKPASSAKLRAHARWCLGSWLEAGDGIFWISGSAGTGKSSLIRFIANDPETTVRLTHWAGERRLVFTNIIPPDGRRSRAHLYRNVLFRILQWIPALVRKIFPDASAAFEHKYHSCLVDHLFFNPAALERAFETLVSLDTGDDHRICILMDGFDEYVGGREQEDHHDRGNLDEQLWRWVGGRKVKLLVSSRPGMRASHPVPEKNMIRLEAVTGTDVAAWCRLMLENTDVMCGVEGLGSLTRSILGAIVRKAEGRFLWARLATRLLLSHTPTGPTHNQNAVPLTVVKVKVESLPRDIGDMYSMIFDAIEEGDRATVFKMLLLVAGHPTRSMADDTSRVDAVHLSWVGDLDDPDFPINRPRVPYSPREVESRRRCVRNQIKASADSFLVVRETLDGDSFVEFSHRTVAEWVDGNEQMQKFRLRIASPDTYTRIALAELWYESCMSTSPGPSGWWCPIRSLNHPGYMCRKELLDGFIHVHDMFGGPHTLYGRSFLHQLAHSHPVSHYFRWKAARNELIDVDGAPILSLLATSLLGGQVENVRTLLDLGLSPKRNMRVWSHIQSNHADVSIWVAYLWSFAEKIIYGMPQRTSGGSKIGHQLADMDHWTMLNMLLEAGCDPECAFLLSERADNVPTHAISLRRLISNSQKPEGVEIPMDILRGSHHPGVNGCKPYGLYKQERALGIGDGSYDIDRAKFKLVAVKCGSEELEWQFSKVQVY